MLATGHLAGGVIDVYSTELLQADHAFGSIPTLPDTHTGWQSLEAVRRLIAHAVAILHAELGPDRN